MGVCHSELKLRWTFRDNWPLKSYGFVIKANKTWVFFYQIIFDPNKAGFSFSKVTLGLLWALHNLKSAVLVTSWLWASFFIHCTHFGHGQVINCCKF